ncbi:DUF892 family protein [Mangrovivirga sp. M17]|uniref:DUF892 family protein n=1 Tax=Mangrovivirga halotolerans TaxID=2993936 RepID=A0ABT3RQ36_9BACT|nr:DUF892 family protein [Mangrovivirga halotolerans]MCX2743746.1 DUF892 family protein [Mangrovivirga halotolerans]
MRHIKNFEDLFVEQLKEQFHGERQQHGALMTLREKATDTSLLQAIDHHIGQVKRQMKSMERVFELLNRNLHGEENVGVKGLIQEAIELAERCTNDAVRDAGILSSIQQLNHHNIASFGTLCTYAKELGLEEIKLLLGGSLEEQKSIDQDLSSLAIDSINLMAMK